MAVQKFALGISYDGSPFHGWQRQQSQQTVQQALEEALSRVADHPVRLAAAGRTDAGVHATGQVSSFVSGAERSLRDWMRGANALTPEAIAVDWVQPVDDRFHPRYSAVARAYHYVFHDHGNAAGDPFLRLRAWSTRPLDADAMHRGAQQLLGEHDFSAFRGAGCQSLTPQRRVNFCTVRRAGQFVVMHIEANAFLLHMVRNIARALHDAGRDGDSGRVGNLLRGRDRTRLGATAPPHGLYLSRVAYPQYDLPSGRQPFFLGF